VAINNSVGTAQPYKQYYIVTAISVYWLQWVDTDYEQAELQNLQLSDGLYTLQELAAARTMLQVYLDFKTYFGFN